EVRVLAHALEARGYAPSPARESIASMPMGTSLRRRSVLARARVGLYGPDRAAVLLEPADGRWPEHERADRLRLAVGLAALAAHRVAGGWWAPLREARGTRGGRVASTEGALPAGTVDLAPLGGRGPLAVVPWEGPGRHEVVTELTRSAVGPVPVLRGGGDRVAPTAAVGALALGVAVAVDAAADGRLALGLALEGVVGWYRESHRLTAPRNAVGYAIAHAAARLEEAGRPVPPELRG